MKPRLFSWSFSTHAQLLRCPAKVKYAKIDKLPDPSGYAAERGSRLGEALEQYTLRSTQPTGVFTPDRASYPLEILAWKPALDERLARYASVRPEFEIGLDANWNPQPWDRATIRAKLDLVGIVDDTTIEVIDYKTGRQYPEHKDQLELYATLLFHCYDWCERVLVADWYLDRPGEIVEDKYLRPEYERTLLPRWKQRAVADLSRTIWPAQRNVFCRYCAFHAKVGGPCTEGA